AGRSSPAGDSLRDGRSGLGARWDRDADRPLPGLLARSARSGHMTTAGASATRESSASKSVSRYDILFEPVQLGPVTARNRFFQVPHCNGLGHLRPAALAEMRGVKAEGGWAVVCTEEVAFHWANDLTPFAEGRLIDDQDLPAHERMVER